MIEMPDRLAHRKADLMAVEAGREHHVDQVAGAGFLADGVQHDIEPVRVMFGELPQPVLHVAERLAVRRQDQRVGMQHVEERLAGVAGTRRPRRTPAPHARC